MQRVFYYDWIDFEKIVEPVDRPLDAFKVIPSVVYREMDGTLYEKVTVYLEYGLPHVDGELTLTLSTEQGEEVVVTLPNESVHFGHTSFSFEIEDGEGPVFYRLQGRLNSVPIVENGSFQRRRKWKVYTSPHVHTDIGYTHRQWEVAERLCRNLDQALELVQQGREKSELWGYPPFTHVLDSSWALEEFEEYRDQAMQEALKEAVRRGEIGVPSNYTDLLTQYASLEDLIRNGEFSDGFLREVGKRAEHAAIVDVASASGSLPAILEGMGVKYLVHANNQDRGPFRLNGNLHHLNPFYWEGVAGGRVLVWLAKMYCELKKVCGSPATPATAAKGLQIWLDEFERDDYVPDAVLLYGQDADNTDIDPYPIEFVKEWNETYAYPKLIPCDIDTFFRYIEDRFGASFRSVKGDQGAYWEDGVGSSIAESIMVRRAQAMIPAAEKLDALAALHGTGSSFPLHHYDAAWREVLLYDEHTWGAFLSGSDPTALLQTDQWKTKQHMAVSALMWGERLLHASATRHSLNWNNEGREIVVYNPHSWPMSSAVTVEIGRGEQAVDPLTGQILPMRLIRETATQAIVQLWIDEIPGFSYRRYLLQSMPPKAMGKEGTVATNDNSVIVLSNLYYRVTIDSNRGCITSWIDMETGTELIDTDNMHGFGTFLYACGGEGTKLLGNHADKTDEGAELVCEFERLSLQTEDSDWAQSVVVRGRVPMGELTIEWLLYRSAKRLDLRFHYDKIETTSTEAAYIAFPLRLTQAEVLSDSQLGWVNWDRDQLPGACKEWLPLQTAMIVHGCEAAVTIASPEIPLFTVGEEVKGRWPKALQLSGNKVYSYVLNNYWKSNYKPSQGGPIAFSYALTSSPKLKLDESYRFGHSARLGLYAQRMSYQEHRTVKIPYDDRMGGALAVVEPLQVAVTAFKKARHWKGWIMRLQEIGGEMRLASIEVPGRPIRQAYITDLLEYDLNPLEVSAQGTVQVPVGAWGLSTVRLIF